MNETASIVIEGYHAHVYFDRDTWERARTLCTAAGRRFPVEVGRMHERPVGPHPRWSCQLAFAPAHFGEIVPWLALNRGGLTVFVHPRTGDDLRDHRDHALWMGKVETLDLSVF